MLPPPGKRFYRSSGSERMPFLTPGPKVWPQLLSRSPVQVRDPLFISPWSSELQGLLFLLVLKTRLCARLPFLAGGAAVFSDQDSLCCRWQTPLCSLLTCLGLNILFLTLNEGKNQGPGVFCEWMWGGILRSGPCEGAACVAMELASLCVCSISEHRLLRDPPWARILAGPLVWPWKFFNLSIKA